MKKTLLTLTIVAMTSVACNSEHKAEKAENNDNPFAVTGPDFQAGRTAPNHKDRLIFDNVNLITMSEDDAGQVLLDQRVVIEKNRIVEFGDAQTILLDNAEVIDGQNGYLLPGFIDSHAHMAFDPIEEEQAHVWTDPAQMAMYLQQGITTIRSYSGNPRNLEWRDKVNSGEWLGTRILSSGPIIHDREAEEQDMGFSIDDFDEDFLALITTTFPKDEEDSKRVVAEQSAMGYDFIKVYSGVKEALYLAMAEQVEEENIFLAGHAPEAPLETVLEYHDEIAHLMVLIESYDEFEDDYSWEEYESWVIETMLANNVALVSNWSTDEVVMEMEQGIDVFSRARYNILPPAIHDAWRAHSEAGGTVEPELQLQALSLLKNIIDAGIVVQAGSDTVEPGSIPEFVLRDMELVVEAGVSPYQALLTATNNPAKIISRITEQPQNRGIIRAGYFADLVLLKNDPLEDISNVRNRHGVMIDGHWLSQEQLALMIKDFKTMPLDPLMIKFKE